MGAYDWTTGTSYLATTTATTATQQRDGWTALEHQHGTFTSSSISSTRIENATATVRGTLEFSKDTVPFTLKLVKQDGVWKIE